MNTKYETEVYSRWGATDAYREHEQKTKNYTKEKWAEATDDTYGKGYSATVDGISVGYYQYKSTSTAVAPSSDHIRVYKSSVLKIDSEKTITKVILYCTASDKCVDMTVLEGDGNGFTADTASLTIEWTGNAKNIVAQASNGQVRITKIVFVCE